MNKVHVVCIVAVVLGSGVAAGLTSAQPTLQVQTQAVSFSEVQFHEVDGAVSLSLPEASSYTTTPGEPILPVVTRVFTFPFRTHIDDVTVQFSGGHTQPLLLPLMTATTVRPDEEITALVTVQGGNAQASFSYSLGGGLCGEMHVTYLAVHLSPVSYDPLEQSVTCALGATITVTYSLPQPLPQPVDDYKLVVIAPKEFASTLEPLIAHKIAHNVTVKLVNTEEVCNGTYFPAQGRDCAEKMKYFIKNATEQWGTSYVLLAGGRKGGIQTEKWWLPVRYSHLDDGGEGTFLSDLYFEDLYDSEGNFQTWDTNDNGIFGEWTNTSKDILDMYPDVCVGRLPCTSVADVNILVKKIVTYETTTAGSDWFHRFIGIAGDTYPAEGDPVFEGEVTTAKSYSMLKPLGFTATYLWTSLGTFTGSQDVIAGISEGAGFVHFSGHGNPSIWSTHKPYNDSFVDGLKTSDMHKLKNGEKLPIVIVGGCHNAQYNTSLCNIASGVLKYGLKYFQSTRPYGKFYYMEWVPQCWAYDMLEQRHGGCIGIIANTGLGYGAPGWDTLNQSGRLLEWSFFQAYANGSQNLGMAHAMSLVHYMLLYPPMAELIDCKIIQEWGLLGDPSLQMGGFAS